MEFSKIAIIDSGIGNYVSNYVIKVKDFMNENSNNFEDLNGHGTMCYSLIKHIVPDTEFYIIKILNRELKSSSIKLIEALEYLKKIEINIINLSLSTEEIKYKKKIQDVCIQLCRQNKMIVASSSNNERISYPDTLKGVIGVKGNIFKENEIFWYNKYQNIQCIANKTPYLFLNHKNQYQFFGGNSKAAACMTGIIAKNWDRLRDFDNIKREEILMNIAQKNSWNKNMILKKPDKIHDKNKEFNTYMVNKIKDIVLDVMRISKNSQDNFYYNLIYNKNFNDTAAYEILSTIEKVFQIKIEYEKISILDFSSIFSLEKIVKNYMYSS